MNLIKVYGFFLLMMAVMLPAQVSGHALWKPGSITPGRTTHPTNDQGLGPCGGRGTVALPRSSKPKIFRLGEKITVEWVETINHEGEYIIEFLDETYNPLIPPSKMTEPDTRVRVNNPGPDPRYQYRSKLITIPNINCPNCVLSLIQDQWNAPTKPIGVTTTKYYSCSDIRIESSSNAAPGEVTSNKATNINTKEARINNTNSVELNWVNPGKDPLKPRNVAYRVLILSDIKPIGTLIDGKPYVVGDMVGTATVRYNGNLETATIMNLTNTNSLHFKIFTYDVSNNYSAGIMLAATPVVAPIIPLIELSLSQGTGNAPAIEFDKSQGIITATVSITNSAQGDTFTYDWSKTDSMVLAQEVTSIPAKNSNVFKFDPMNLDPNKYDIVVSATNRVASNGQTSAAKIIPVTILVPPQQGGETTPPTTGPAPTTEPAQKKPNNGIDSGGCSLSVNAKFDPLLLLLALLSILVVGIRIRKQR